MRALQTTHVFLRRNGLQVLGAMRRDSYVRAQELWGDCAGGNVSEGGAPPRMDCSTLLSSHRIPASVKHANRRLHVTGHRVAGFECQRVTCGRQPLTLPRNRMP